METTVRTLRLLALATALLLVLGEVARRGVPGLFPLGLDDLLVAAALAWAAWRAGTRGPAPLLAAWSGFCGFVLVVLVINAAPLFGAAEKRGAALYAAVLGTMLIVGLWAAWRSMRLIERRAAAPDRN